MHPVNYVRAASFLLIAASFPVAAAEPAPAQVAAAAGQKKEVPWRGSSVRYGHAFTALSVDRAADPLYNPYYAQSLSLQPQWHFHPLLYVGARFELEQELTLADDTTYAREVVASDLSFDVGTSGLREPRSGVRVSGTLRLTAPTSKASKAQTKLFSVAPGLGLSRRFELRSGLTLGYSARYNQRFHRYTTVQFDAPTIGACGDLRDQSCAAFLSTGARNVQGDLQQGPSVSFDPAGALHLSASFLWMHGWVYPLAPARLDAGAGPRALDPFFDAPVRETNAFLLSAGYDLTRELSLSVGVSTFTSQPGLDGLRRSPFFNRNTTVSLDASVDVEALLSRI